jgi:hypothetical protein
MSLEDGLAWRHPGDFYRLQQASFRAELRNAFTVSQPNAFMTITGLADGHGPLPINLGRLYTRHMRGIIEMERDQRRRARLHR